MSDNTFFMVMFSFGVAIGALALVHVIRNLFSSRSGEIGGWELRGASERILAIARTTIADGVRSRMATGFIGIIAVSIPLFLIFAKGDGTIKGRVQMFVAYSMGLTSLALALLTIFFACRSLSHEIASRQIYGIVTKPVPRWQIVAGKWVGVMALDVVLLAFAALATYVGTEITVGTFKSRLRQDLQVYSGLTPDQAMVLVAALDEVTGVGRKGVESPVVSAMAQAIGRTNDQVGEILLKLPEESRVDLRRFDELRRQVLVSRASVSAKVPDLSEDVIKEYKRLEDEKALPEGWTREQILRQIRLTLNTAYCSVAPGGGRQWRLQGPPPEPGKKFILSVRFKIHAPGQLLAGDYGGTMLEADTLVSRWWLGDPTKPSFLETIDAYPVESFQEFEVPSQCVDRDGTVILNYMDVDPRRVPAVIDLPHHHLQLLYRIGSFELNLFQAAAAMLIPLASLAAMGVCALTFLTFPVGSLIVVTLYLISSSMSFISESLSITEEYAPATKDLSWEVRKATVDSLDWLLQVGDCDPIGQLIDGRSIGWPTLWQNGLEFVGIKGSLVLFVAVLVLRRRELATVIV